ncbi:hypothetical protein D043_3873A, partial [Vibrio parahaemolyticus EKP-021]
MQKYNTQFIT